MKKALHITTAGIMALAFVFSCIVFPKVTHAAPKKTTVTIVSPVKVKKGKTGKYTVYQNKGEKVSFKIKAKTNRGKVKYKSSDKTILTVSSKGTVKTTGKKNGTAVITVYSSADKKAKAKIKVTVKTAKYTFYLVRHGRTVFNDLGLAQGWCDSPLTPKGVAMAKKLHQTMAKIPFDKCYTSISERAYDTANYIIEGRKIPLFIDENLKETNCGTVEGTKDPKNFMERIGWDVGYVEEGGESMHQTADRFEKAIKRIIRENPSGGTFLVTSHGGAITAYLDLMFNQRYPDPKWNEFLAGEYHGSMPNCATSIMTYSEGKYALQKVSDVSYLGELAEANPNH